MDHTTPRQIHTETREVGPVAAHQTHTAGPWAWNEKGTQLWGADGQVLAIDLPEFISDADKRLIASAPDLYDALMRLRDLDIDCSQQEDNAAWTIAHAAIAKAEGP